MAGLLELENGKYWMVKNWVFKQFLSHVIKQNSGDKQVALVLEQAIVHDGLFFDEVRRANGSDVSKRIGFALRQSAEQVVRGDFSDLQNLEAQGARMYLDALGELIEILKTDCKIS